jgi:hypothetical protein
MRKTGFQIAARKSNTGVNRSGSPYFRDGSELPCKNQFRARLTRGEDEVSRCSAPTKETVCAMRRTDDFGDDVGGREPQAGD